MDFLLLIVMVKHEVNAFRVKPTFSLRFALLLAAYIVAMYAAIHIADMLTYATEDEADSPLGVDNSTAY